MFEIVQVFKSQKGGHSIQSTQFKATKDRNTTGNDVAASATLFFRMAFLPENQEASDG